ncbi:MAG: hypothetical protein U0325_30405 [Polyangiales bacterium]
MRTRHALPLVTAVLVVTPLLLGGAWAPSVPVSALLAAIAFALTGIPGEYVKRDPLVRAWLVLVAVSVLQLAPWPPALLRLLDPAGAEASSRALWALGTARASTWRSLHRDPGSGIADLVYLLGLGAMYLAVFTASMRGHLERIYLTCATAALIVAGVALAHLSTGQDLLYAFYRPQQAAPPILSPLLNANHLAALTGTGAILWIGSASDARNGLARVLQGIAAVLCGAVCALSMSRGGVAAAVGGVAVFVALNARGRGEAERRRERTDVRRQNLTAVGLGVAVFGAGIWVAATGLRQEFLAGDSSKLDIFRRAAGALRGHALLGLGSGALPVTVSTAGHLDAAWTFLRAECLPLDLALAFGLPAAAFVLFCLVHALRRLLPSGSAPPPAVAAWSALLALLLHDFVDFSMFFGATGYVAAAVAGVLAGGRATEWRRPMERFQRVHRWPAGVIALTVLGLGTVAWRSPLEAERDAMERALRREPASFSGPAVRAALTRHPLDAYLQLLAGSYAIARDDASGLRFVARAMELSPNWHAPHLLLARAMVARGRRGQAKVELAETLRRAPDHAFAVADVALRLSPPLDEAEMDHMAPRDPSGVVFLDFLATRPGTTPAIAAVADEVQLRRDPNQRGPLMRRASDARTAGDLRRAETLCARLAQAHPRSPSGYECQASMLAARGDTEGALRVLAVGLQRVTSKYELHGVRARLLAGRRDAAGMRREITAMLETAGADVDRRIGAHGLHGRLEVEVGSDPAAWEAFESAEALALPAHPYLRDMLLVAARMRDRPAVDAACATLMETMAADPVVQQHCDRGGRDAGAR